MAVDCLMIGSSVNKLIALAFQLFYYFVIKSTLALFFPEVAHWSVFLVTKTEQPVYMRYNS